jgi:type I restriction enzyme S subunit
MLRSRLIFLERSLASPPHIANGRVTQDTVKLTFVRDDIPARYVYWLLRTPIYREYCRAHAIGTTNLSISREDFLAFPIPQPTDRELKLVETLDALDDKIELNRQMNATLGAIVQTVFKSWFADALENGAPNGWRPSTIRDLASNIQYGLTQSASSEPIGPRFLRITDIQGGRINWGAVPFCRVSEEEHERYRLKPGDVLVARTGASTGENIHLTTVPDAVFASYLVRFQFTEPEMARFVGAFMRTPSYFDFVAGCIGGSAQPNASAQTLAGAELFVPPRQLLKRFADTLAPIDQRIAANTEESRILATLRDTLLPKLISGQLSLMNGNA